LEAEQLTAAVLPAIAFLIIVHRAVLAGFLAALRLCGKTGTANRCRQNRKQNPGVIFHRASLARPEMTPAENRCCVLGLRETGHCFYKSAIQQLVRREISSFRHPAET
jgi:hypothetical protein